MSDIFAAILQLRSLLADLAQHKIDLRAAQPKYSQLRSQALSSEVAEAIPEWVKHVLTTEEFWDFISTKSGTYKGRRTFLNSEFAEAIARAEQRSGSQAQQVFKAGQPHDAFVAIREAIKAAKKDLLIADSYVDQSLWPLVSNLGNAVTLRILTEKMQGDFALEGKRFVQQHGIKVEIRKTGKIHDRFIAADGARLWHLGTSINNAGNKLFLMSELTSHAIVAAALGELEHEWKRAIVVPFS